MAGSLITTGVAVLTPAKKGSTVPLKIDLLMGADGAGVFKEDLVVVLAVYDLDQYFKHQKGLTDGFRETDRAFFNGSKKAFPEDIRDHEVQAGTGVIFQAELKLAKKITKVKSGAGTKNVTTFFVAEVVNLDKVSDPGYKLDLLLPSSVDEQGQALSSGVVDMRSVGQGGAFAADFAKITEHGEVTRKISFRFLSQDRTKVLLSQLDPNHCLMGIPLEISYSNQGADQAVGADAPKVADAPKPKPTEPKVDATGFYVLEVDPSDATKDPYDIVSPAAMYIHHVGRAACGWYYPVASSLLDASQPLFDGTSQRLFPTGVRNSMPSLQRMCFVVQRKFENEEAPVYPIECLFTDEPNDPDILRTVKDRDGGAAGQTTADAKGELVIPLDQRKTHELAFNFEDGEGGKRVVKNVDLFIEGNEITGGSFFTFRRVHSNSRLAWKLLDEFLSDPRLPEDKKKEFRATIVNECMEPIPPGTLAQLLGWITSPPMIKLILDESVAQGAGQTSQRLAPQSLVNDALLNQATALQNAFGVTKMTGEIIALWRSIAGHHIIKQGDFETTLLRVLEGIMLDILEQLVRRDGDANGDGVRDTQFVQNLPPGRPTPAEYTQHSGDAIFRGFAAFNISPKRLKDSLGRTSFKQFLYRLKFTNLDLLDRDDGRLLKGSIGIFKVAISKLDPDTLQDADQINFPKTEFAGILGAGSIGLSMALPAEFTQSKVESNSSGEVFTIPGTINAKPLSKGPGSARAEDCDIFSMADILTPAEFNSARFVIFAQHFPSFNLRGGPVGVGTGDFHESNFSITLPDRLPNITLETVIKQSVTPGFQGPDFNKVQRYLRRVRDAANSGSPIPVGEGNVTLYTFSIVAGILLTDKQVTPVARIVEPDKDMQALSVKTLEVNVSMVGAHFNRNSSVVSGNAREILELKLAVQRKIVEYPGWIDIQGTASPEWGQISRSGAERENVLLSQKRASSVLRAIFAATGQPGQGIIKSTKEYTAIGKGAKPFESLFSNTLDPSGLNHLDPFSPAARDKGKGAAEIEKDRKDFYPSLRRVDVVMNGVYALRIFGD
jgi:hypothetical protein